MAIWQVTFFIVPKGEVMPFVGDFRDFDWWKHAAVDKLEIITFLSGLFKDFKQPLWSEYSWGDSERNDAWLSYDEHSGKIEDFSFRLDLRDDFEPFLRQILEFCVRMNFALLDEKGNKIEPVIEDAMLAIRSSKAFRFVLEPKQFLENLSKNEGNF